MAPTDTVSGGCLCGTVRYEIDFSGLSGWPPKTHTCQCTQCRKWSGALIVPWIDTTPSRVAWFSHAQPAEKTASPSDLQSFTEYSASAGIYRGFCKTCGSPLTWRNDKEPDQLEIVTGSVDGDVMAGEMGKVLGKASGGHYWCGGSIEGVTDREAGRRFQEGSGSEEVGGRE